MLTERNDLMTKLMDIVENQLTPVVQEFTPLLRKLTSLSGQRYAPVVLKARKILMMETVRMKNVFGALVFVFCVARFGLKFSISRVVHEAFCT